MVDDYRRDRLFAIARAVALDSVTSWESGTEERWTIKLKSGAVHYLILYDTKKKTVVVQPTYNKLRDFIKGEGEHKNVSIEELKVATFLDEWQGGNATIWSKKTKKIQDQSPAEEEVDYFLSGIPAPIPKIQDTHHFPRPMLPMMGAGYQQGLMMTDMFGIPMTMQNMMMNNMTQQQLCGTPSAHSIFQMQMPAHQAESSVPSMTSNKRPADEGENGQGETYSSQEWRQWVEGVWDQEEKKVPEPKKVKMEKEEE